ncbi:MAG: SDR family NAD(P)-dependent oxidoreductase [Nostoc sp. DedVER02]|uniref:type I polyketide synthase n=1 Tax=unclassified Nostoc TaxID=2593658 RepID=UPI002AD26336|nr:MULTISPECIES: SDR family NAD(P)-dependent oxidoreductase [unclassified Nostoc]MDZ7985850.1 SDR family NAD(P)-dependent oxidoreductase [Nostoc sp. DedVER02]MDZ8114685.1 SDR family NAD(P)-dependent oxidoreductase [Nostoc sp. DedVER01b]
MDSNTLTGSEIAIIGLSGRFPGAKDIDEFWDNLQNGVESISFFTDEELLSAGISSSILNDPKYVKAQAVLEDAELFDAEFFGYNPREAEITDPQHRIFLECAWSALENAGYDSQNYQGAIGVYAGSALNTYLLNIYLNPNIINSIDPQQLILAGNKDFLTTRVSYKLNLEGPSYAVQTACSTSLVAVHLACQSLLNGECDIALAGGVAISATRKEGYAYTEGGILSPDGHCRAFDADAQGSVGGEGVGIVVLKRLEDALSDRDTIHAVIKGSAINNDGSFKVSYTAPRIDTQAKVIRTAQIVAEVEAETITYVETHGTATALGDPIEIAALTQAFRSSTENIGFCAIGSVKTNIGHLDTAAGVTGLIKTVLALKHKQIPPSLHFTSPNPEIDFANSPFYVNTKLAEWETNGSPRRAGVSSFGLGGTNVHLIVEEAPIVGEQGSRGAGEQGRKYHLLVLSTKTESALEIATKNLANYLQKYPDLNLADVAYTLQVGRRNFDYRRAVVCRDMQDALNALQEPKRVLTSTQKTQERPVAFMFSGLGTHYVDMALELYQTEPTFRVSVDQCCELLKPQLGLDLRDVLYPQNGKKSSTLSAGLDLRKMLGRGTEQTDVSSQKLNQTFLTQPAIFVIEYALAQLWMSWGIRPSAMIGYSIGEYVAATLAEVLSLEDALTLVAKRAQMIQELPSGAMLAIALSEEEIKPLLNDKISMSAINGSSLCVIAGFTDAIEELERQLSERGLVGKRLQTSHAFHSVMMEAIAPTFHDLVNTFSLKSPKIPYLSNVTGTWITADQATDPSYWVKHLCQAVRFADGVKQLWQKDNPILLEVGPGQALSSFASQCLDDDRAKSVMLPSLRHSYEQQSDVAFLMNTLGRLWLAGVKVDWSGFYVREKRDRIPLPTYPFERQRYWIDANPEAQLATRSPQALYKKPNITDWFYIPSWKRSPHLGGKSTQKLCYVVFINTAEFGSGVAKQLELQGHDVITVTVGEQFRQLSEKSYAINPQSSRDYDALVKELWNFKSNAIAGWHFVHFWSLIPNAQSSHQFFEECQNLGFYSLLFLAQALGKEEVTDVQFLVATNNVQEVNGDEQLCPEKATILGICKVIPQEYPNITCRQIDVVIPESGTRQENQLIDQLVTELTQTASENIIAYRGKHRWVQTFEPIQLEEPNQETIPIREGGVYLIVGGLGDVGLVLAEYLAQTAHTKLILTGRSGLPAKTEWLQWLATHDDNDDISRKIQKIQALEALGAEVLICRADVANLEQMQAVMTQASKRFGEIHGVIHTATVRVYNTVQQISKTECETQFRSTGYGLFVLEKILQERQLDFCVIISSLASVLGVMGMAAYPAAHIFTDAFVHKHNQTSLIPWLSINYGDWITQEFSESMAKGADSMMTRAEGLEVFKRALSRSKFTQIVTSTVDLQASIKRWIQLEFNQNSQLASKTNSGSSYLRPNLDNAYVAPRSEVEETIAHIWQELLGIGQVGIDDSFFELGGDSVLGIQVSARAAKAGFRLTPQQLFEHQTIAKLAGVISTSQVVQAEQGLVTGSLPLTPIHHRFFERNISEPHHWNQSIFLEAAEVIDPAVLEQAWQQLLLHHDALRLRFKFTESGWQAMNSGYEEIPFTHIDLSALSEDAQELEIKTITVQLQTSLNLSAGPIVRVALFDLGANKSSRLLIVAHHLGVDPGSWRVLLEDLQTAYQQIRQGKAIELPPKTTSYKQWALRLEEYANSANLQKAKNYWLSDRHKQSPLPIDYSDSINNMASEQIVSVTLGNKDTQALLQEVPGVYRTNTQEVLLTAFVQAFAQWTGKNSLLIDLEENGREVSTSGIDNVDISRTVGWITTTYPVLLDLEKADNPGDALKVVKEQLRSISGEGLDYGVLRYLSQDTVVQEKIRSIPQAEVAFLYIGQLAKSLPQDSLFQLSEEIPEGMISLQATRQHKLHLIASVVEGQLQLDWYYSKNVHERQTVEKLANNFVQALLSLITHCQSLEAGEYTPSDFSAANINQDNLSKLLAQVGQSSRRNS